MRFTLDLPLASFFAVLIVPDCSQLFYELLNTIPRMFCRGINITKYKNILLSKSKIQDGRVNSDRAVADIGAL